MEVHDEDSVDDQSDDKLSNNCVSIVSSMGTATFLATALRTTSLEFG